MSHKDHKDHKTVKEIMTTHPITISEDEALPDAALLMKKHGFRRLPVMRGERLVGIITDRDVKEAMPSQATSLSIWEINYLLSKLKVKEVMSKPVLTVLEDASLEYVAKLLIKNKIGGVPVLWGDELRGIVTVTDLLRAFLPED
jgi:acetoin utilization protein AcuB